MFKTIQTHIDSSGVGHLILNRPEIHNAFDEHMIQEITQQLSEWKDNKSLRLILLEGAGKSFCAGADVNWMKKMKNYSHEENVQDALKMANMFHLLNSFRAPVVAYVHGFALGGGMGLISCCDFVLAHTETKFGFTETVLGLIPAVISPFAISKIGETHARAYMLSGHQFDSLKANNIGLVHELTNDETKVSDKEKILSSFLKAAPKAQNKAKQLINEVLKDLQCKGLRVDSLTQKTAEFIAQTRAGDEAQEGMGALLEKRKPNWIMKSI